MPQKLRTAMDGSGGVAPTRIGLCDIHEEASRSGG